MANRPVYVSSFSEELFYVENVEFDWYAGFSLNQKQKCIQSLHQEFHKTKPHNKILEISSKSQNDLGVKLSAFNLVIQTKNDKYFTVETAFQSSKVFSNGGPYQDILKLPSKQAKKDDRLKKSGNLVGFKYFNRDFPIEPKTFFYNWLYINALFSQKELTSEIINYSAFSDIEFNPNKSINSQAEAAAIFVSLSINNLIDDAIKDVDQFKKIVYPNFKESDSTQIELL